MEVYPSYDIYDISCNIHKILPYIYSTRKYLHCSPIVQSLLFFFHAINLYCVKYVSTLEVILKMRQKSLIPLANLFLKFLSI